MKPLQSVNSRFLLGFFFRALRWKSLPTSSVSGQVESENQPLSCNTIVILEVIKESIRHKTWEPNNFSTICLFFRLQLISVSDLKTSPVVLLITFGLHSWQGNSDIRKHIVDLAFEK